MKNALVAVMIAVAGIYSAGCSVATGQRSAGDVVDDSTITTRVKTRFAESKDVAATRISVETLKGVVQLSGFAIRSERVQARRFRCGAGLSRCRTESSLTATDRSAGPRGTVCCGRQRCVWVRGARQAITSRLNSSLFEPCAWPLHAHTEDIVPRLDFATIPHTHGVPGRARRRVHCGAPKAAQRAREMGGQQPASVRTAMPDGAGSI